MLVWNERRAAPGFQTDYETVIRDCAPEKNRIQEASIDVVFGHRDWRLTEFPNRQHLDLAGLQGRLASSSYAPLPDSPGYGPLMDALQTLFEKYQQDGRVTLLYDTKVYWGVYPGWLKAAPSGSAAFQQHHVAPHATQLPDPLAHAHHPESQSPVQFRGSRYSPERKSPACSCPDSLALRFRHTSSFQQNVSYTPRPRARPAI